MTKPNKAWYLQSFLNTIITTFPLKLILNKYLKKRTLYAKLKQIINTTSYLKKVLIL